MKMKIGTPTRMTKRLPLPSNTTQAQRVNRVLQKTKCPMCSRRELFVHHKDVHIIGRRTPCFASVVNKDLSVSYHLMYRTRTLIGCDSYKCNSSWVWYPSDKLYLQPTAYLRAFTNTRPTLCLPQ